MWVYRDIQETDNVRCKAKWRGGWYECKQVDEIPEGWFTLPKKDEPEKEPRKPGRPKK